MNVPELVPQVTLLQRNRIGALEEFSPGDRFEHGEVRRLRFVPTREQPVDGPDASIGGDDEVGPTASHLPW